MASIAASVMEWHRSVSAMAVSATFDDEIQRARVIFLDLPPDGRVKLELVEPLSPNSPVASFLEKGGGLHHLCFEVDNIEEQIGVMRAARAMLIRRPKPAVAFHGRRIAWMLTAGKLLAEYLERAPIR